jgi:hypothetical protein
VVLKISQFLHQLGLYRLGINCFFGSIGWPQYWIKFVLQLIDEDVQNLNRFWLAAFLGEPHQLLIFYRPKLFLGSGRFCWGFELWGGVIHNEGQEL